MLELFGSWYLIEHVIAEHNIREKEFAYRNYVSDLLKCIAERNGFSVFYSYREMIEPQKETPENGDEIAIQVIKKLGLKGKADERI